MSLPMSLRNRPQQEPELPERPSANEEMLRSIKVKRELHACANVKFGLRYPATLHITMSDGQTYRFENPDQALEFVNKRLKKNPGPAFEILQRLLARFVFSIYAAVILSRD
ncbi:unnamed protein product [Scomber scombrus]|uniref:Unnamed protein product n=1 Tax=Scomber scombrus TaxID=13677 RepID=A0AAV1NYH7_SCOSC